jgi:preprotein translocase subunit SecA
LERRITLRTIDDLWADYLERMADLRAGIHWQSYASGPPMMLSLDRRDPHWVFLHKIDEWFPELEASLPVEIARRVAEAEASGEEPTDRGAVWTYLTTDQPFGTWTEQVLKGLRRKFLHR